MLQRGWVLAQLHVRGGGEKGRGWHRAGREGNKGTSVSDAIACLEHLQTAGVAPAGRVVLRAESAGGVVAGSVLVSAAATAAVGAEGMDGSSVAPRLLLTDSQ